MNATASLGPLTDLLKQEMLQSMVHDLRTPIAVIKGNLMILLSGMMGQLPADQKMLLERSMGPIEEMLQMTDNMLQASKLEDQQVSIERRPMDLDRLIAETIEFYETPFQQRHLRIFRDGNTVGVRLNADVFWVKRVLHNLIWNAYKYTPENGNVSLQVTHKGSAIEVAVQDTGCGISPDKLDTIFEKFGQANVLNDRKLGTGLGLWISKRVLELHGGSIRCESDPGRGSRFVMTFPADCVL